MILTREGRKNLVRSLQEIRKAFLIVSRNERYVLEELEAIENATDEQLEAVLVTIWNATEERGA